jgi:hypothetical protein
MIRVCSGFSPTGRIQYGERFLSSFNRRWPRKVELSVYVEEPMPMPREACRDLWAIDGASAFHSRHANSEKVHGREVQPNWKEREVHRGYSFRHDAYKFWKQILIPEAAAADMPDSSILVWLDGDVETVREVPDSLVERLLGDGEVCYLNRSRQHSEIGFWAVRLNTRTRQFLHDIAEVYRSDRFLELDEWHSAFVWDHVRQSAGLAERPLCRSGLHGHVWPYTALAPYMRHDKGLRKGN